MVQTVEELNYHPDCPVCLQPSFYPVKLPCGHIFCFLCIKGVVLRSRKCALCRHAVTAVYLENPTFIRVVEKDSKEENSCKTVEKNGDGSSEDQDFVWYYEGRNGWWAYDEKTSPEVEKAFKSGQRSCTLLIAGFLYVVDFENMFQTRKNEPGRRRRIKRDKRDVDRKGVAGIRIPPSSRLTAPAQTADSLGIDKRDNGENQGEVVHSTSEVSNDTSSTQHVLRESSQVQSQGESGVEEVTTRLEGASL